MLLKHSSYVLFFCLQLCVIACSKPSPVAQNAIDLLSTKVSASEAMEFSGFNQGLTAAISFGETWPKEPVMVMRRFLQWGEGVESVYVLEGQGEFVSNIKFVVITNLLGNDSVQGERIEGTLESDAQYNWKITSARKSWRCVSGRGHEDFGTVPCS